MALSYRKPKYQSVITVLTAYKTVKAVSRSPLATPIYTRTVLHVFLVYATNIGLLS